MSPSHSGSDQGAYRRISLQGGNCLKLDNMRRAIAGEIFVSVLRDWSINIREFVSLKSSSSPRAWPASWARVSPTSIPGGSPFWGSRERQHRSEIYPMGVIAPHDFRAGCAHHLQWRQAVTRKAAPTKIAPMPPTVAHELPPERSFRSAWCWFTIISIPKIEKPRDKLTKLTPVEISPNVCRLNNRLGVSVFDSLP
jgi:hypothetical protein